MTQPSVTDLQTRFPWREVECRYLPNGDQYRIDSRVIQGGREVRVVLNDGEDDHWVILDRDQTLQVAHALLRGLGDRESGAVRQARRLLNASIPPDPEGF